MARDYLQHGRRHGPNGSDPIPMLVNDWMTTNTGVSVPNSTVTNMPLTSITYQTDDGSVYTPVDLAVDSIQIRQPGTYLVRAMAAWPSGHTGVATTNAVIGGSGTVYEYDSFYSGGVDLSTTAPAGSVHSIWEQLEVVTATDSVSVYLTAQQNSGGALDVVAYLQIFRLT